MEILGLSVILLDWKGKILDIFLMGYYGMMLLVFCWNVLGDIKMGNLAEL